MGMSEVTHQEVPNAELVALVRSLEASQAALVRRIEVLEHRTGVARYGHVDAPRPQFVTSSGAWVRQVGDYCPTPERPATLDPVVHAHLNSSEDF